ncbi:MAG: LysM peptidoglycan-binding domain-containing protein [Candidatus Marinimicrobia bacterium]|nr:LysM peptidoglycan-binding domain-containing protein [Candidatus Neomarinimicrobiota bacterium]
MSVPKRILSLYQDGVELKTLLASIVKGKIQIEAMDHATLVTPFHHQAGEEPDLGSDGTPLESTEDVFGFNDASSPMVDNMEESESVSADEASGTMVESSSEEQFEEEETNEDILHSLLTRVPAKKYAHAINLPRSIVHTLHLREDYSQVKPKERNKSIFNEIVERLNDTVIPKDHYACLFTPKGDAYAFVYKSDIPIIQAFDDIQSHLKVKPRFVSILPDEIALANLLRYNYNIGEDETVALINIEDVQSTFIITQGDEVLHFSQSIRENLHSPTLLNAISGRLLYDQDLGHYPDITRIILTGEARQIDAKAFFIQENPGLPVQNFVLNPDKFNIPDEFDATFTDYAVPLGLAIHALFPKDNDTIDVNLIPDYIVRRQKTFKLAWHGLLLLIMIFLVPLGINYQYMEKVADQREAVQKISSLEKSINDIEWVTYMVDSLSLAYSTVQEELKNLNALSEGTLRWSDTFEHLLTALEEVNGVWFSDLQSMDKGIELVGYSLYRNRIPRLIEYFEEAEISSVVPVDVRGKTVYRFSLSINSITSDSSAFHPQVISPPSMPIQSLESAASITIIDEAEESLAPSDEEMGTQIIPDSDPGTQDTITPNEDFEQLSDSLLPKEVFDDLMPLTDDISRLADSLNSSPDTSGEMLSIPTQDSFSENDQLKGKGTIVTALKVHRVKRGETLKIIAKNILGEEARWSEIYNLNKDILKSPNRLAIGQSLIVLQDEEGQTEITHRVKSGDNLKSLAELYYGDSERWASLYKLNKKNISNPNRIFPGQVLTIMTVDQRYDFPIQVHTIKAGESLKKIALKYLGDEERWEEIYKMNQKKIRQPNRIYPGQRIKVRNETGVK